MENLLSKEHDCFKTHTLLIKSSASPLFLQVTLLYGLTMQYPDLFQYHCSSMSAQILGQNIYKKVCTTTLTKLGRVFQANLDTINSKNFSERAQNQNHFHSSTRQICLQHNSHVYRYTQKNFGSTIFKNLNPPYKEGGKARC